MTTAHEEAGMTFMQAMLNGQFWNHIGFLSKGAGKLGVSLKVS